MYLALVRTHFCYFWFICIFGCVSSYFSDPDKAVDIGMLCYEFAAVWWSLLGHLANESPQQGGSEVKRGCNVLKARLGKYYKRTKVTSKLPLRKFGPSKLKVKNTLKLKAKAGQARCLMGFTLELANEFKHCDGELGQHRLQAMKTLAEICSMSKKDVLTKQDLMTWRCLSFTHMYHYVSCGFTPQPKFHYFLHLPQQVERGGPVRSFWVYSDETKNKETKAIWQACSKGHSVYQQVLLRLEWLLALKRLKMSCLSRTW